MNLATYYRGFDCWLAAIGRALACACPLVAWLVWRLIVALEDDGRGGIGEGL